jgi:hypothetical protein
MHTALPVLLPGLSQSRDLIGVAKRFGRGPGFGVGLALLPMILAPILAFGDSEAGDAAAVA